MEHIKPLKEMTPRERVSYIFEYYKFHIIAVIVAIFTIGSLVIHFATYRAPVISLIMVNVENMNTQALEDSFDSFLTDNGYNPGKSSVQINSSIVLDMKDSSTYQGQTSLQMLVATHCYSGFFSDSDTFEVYANDTNFLDLEPLLSPELLQKYQEALIYATVPDTGRQYVCGIRLTKANNKWLAESSAYEECCFGILYSDTDDAIVKMFLNYIL